MVPTLLKRAIAAADWVSPALAGEIAHLLFQYPPPATDLSPEQRRLADNAREEFAQAHRERLAFDGGAVALYRFAAKAARRGTAVVVHGWTSRAHYDPDNNNPNRWWNNGRGLPERFG